MLVAKISQCGNISRYFIRGPSSGLRYKQIIQATSSPHTKSVNQFHQSKRYTSKLLPATGNRQLISNNVLKLNSHQKIYLPHIRQFHTSSRRHVHPVLWIFIKPFAKLSVILLGRQARHKVPIRNLLIGGVSLFSVLTGLYYISHIEYTPITNRRRFKAFTSSQFKKISEAEAQMHIEQYKDYILPINHPAVVRVQNVTTRLLHGNKELQEMVLNNDITSWTITVIDDPKLRNAFVLPSGHIFVFTGMLNFIDNDNQLAIVIGHEMSHAYLSHAAELMSNAQLLDMIIIFVMAAMWTIIPNDGLALVTQWYYHKSIDVMLRLPYDRKLEKEADLVGLQFAAKSCFDVREGSVFWSKMSLVEKLETKVTDEAVGVPEWLSTHPLSEKRVEHIENLLPKAIELREDCNCPRLPATDPRTSIKYLRNFVDNEVAIRKTGRNLSQLHHAHKPKPVPA